MIVKLSDRNMLKKLPEFVSKVLTIFLYKTWISLLWQKIRSKLSIA